jgi:hypothetical protein
MKHPEIRLTGCQIKSIEKARKVAEAWHVLEVETGIRETRITLVNCFICPDITDEELDTLNQTAMEQAVRKIIRDLRR